MGAGGGPAGGEARARGGRAPIRFHPVLPPPPRRVAAVRVVAARQCSSVTDPTSHLSPTRRRHDAQEEGERGRSTAPAGPSAAPRGCRPSPPLPRWTRNRKRPRERIKHQTKKHR
ncbi:high mobility group nucleosomal binding domain 1, isoform CRA_a [Rattus norvegicus]|uniref:High mobility group nucleosomal binding domain 1, isoform CRA_a n=1 Tax=Rattus norvegicus TaxID=10116 RepID=A6KPS3_RAT|nr:high mobility group nucleosomal binding domain 1, isoform CRA_a [Rattus norvegicus]